MERDAHYFKVGLFVVISTLALAGFLLWIAGTYDGRNYDRYTVHFTTAITGLNEGAIVRYQGLEVGNVTRIRLSEDKQNLLRVDIQVKEGTPVRGESTAMLGMTGVTGVAFIDIQTQANDQSQPKEDPNERYPVILGRSSQLTEIFRNVPEITDNLLSVSRKLNSILSDDAASSLQATVTNLEKMTRDLNGVLSPQNVANFSKTLDNAAAASADFSSMAKRLDEAAVQVEKTATELKDAVGRNEENFTRFTREGVDQIIRLSEEGRRTAGSIRGLSDKLVEDPSKVIYQPNYHGVEIQK